MKKNLLMISIAVVLLIIPLFSLANTTINEVDGEQENQCSKGLVTCEIIKPRRGSLYLRDIEILDNLGFTLIIGPITIEAEAEVIGAARNWIEVVEFEIDEILTFEDTDSPYQWEWGGTVFGSHSIKAKAFDNNGNYDFDYFSNVIRFF
jgi:hypothetical protein